MIRTAALAALAVLAALATSLLGGCGDARIESVGRPGTGDGEFRDPRGVAVSDRGIAVLDRTGRLQTFGTDGRFAGSFPVVAGDVRRGLPIGLAWLPGGEIAVAHTHESRIVVFTGTGEVLRSFGEYGVAPGQFLYPQRIALDAAGNLFVPEYGFERTNRVQVLRPDGTVLRVVGGPGDDEGGLGRPMGAVPFPDGRLLVADLKAGLVLFAEDGRTLGRFGPPPADGALFRGVCRADDGDVYAADGGRHEVLRFAADGALRGVLGGPDRVADPAHGFREPWDVAWHAGRVYVADMGNHRVARFDPDAVDWRRP